MVYNAFCLTPQDIQEQEAVILRAMLRPEKLLHFLRPGRLVSPCRAVCSCLMAPNTLVATMPAKALAHVTI